MLQAMEYPEETNYKIFLEEGRFSYKDVSIPL